MYDDNAEVFDLYDTHGQRKYLNAKEARRFLKAARSADGPERLFCELLFYTGCRISEALELTPRRIDHDDSRIIFRTLKRRKLVYRALPAPPQLMHGLNRLAQRREPAERLFPWCRQTAWRIIKTMMERAEIEGRQATPRGLRHQFGIRAIGSNIPEGTLQHWMGHARSRTTRIYTMFGGDEERELAKRMW